MKKPKTNHKQWRWPKYLLYILSGRTGKRYLYREHGISLLDELVNGDLRRELDEQALRNLSRVREDELSKKERPLRDIIEKKLQFLVDCGYTDQYNEIDGEYSIVYKKGSERDGYYIAVYFDTQYESCVIRTPDSPFAELSKSVLATPEWRTSYLHATPSVRLDMAVQFLQREATK